MAAVATTLHTAQTQLFGTADVLPDGLHFEPEFITPALESALLAVVQGLPLREARYKTYTARRRVYAWGSRFDFDTYALRERAIGELPEPLALLRERLAAWAGVAPEDFVHVMVSEYRPGTPLGWHRDAPDYELIVGVSLGGPARLRFRPWPHAPRRDDMSAAAASRGTGAPARGDAERVVLDLAPRSAYRMQGTARWGWQHSVPPVPALRHSVTMRTVRPGRGRESA